MPKITTSSDEDEPAQRTTTMLGDILAPLDGLTPYDTPHDRPSAKGSGEEDGGEEDDQEDDQESEEEGMQIRQIHHKDTCSALESMCNICLSLSHDCSNLVF